MKTIRGLAILAGIVAFIIGLRAFGRSYSTTRWPVTPGRVIGSKVRMENGGPRASVEYEFILAGKVYRGRMTSEEAPESLTALYPAGREIPVGYDPGDPGQSILRPEIRWWSLVLTLVGAGLIAGGIVTFVKSRPRMIALLLAAALLPGCRRVPPPEQSGTPPAGDSGRANGPDYYQFLDQPGVGVESADSIWARLPYDSIYLRREPCFGTCPMYDATLYRGGRARYTGTRFVERVGAYRGEVTLEDYGRIAYLMDRLGFMALPDSFAARYTDLPGATMAVSRRPGGTKAVHDYGYVGPVELWSLMQVFDGIVERIQWEKEAP